MIYVFKTHQANASNLFLAVFLEAAGTLVHGPCRYPIRSDGFFDLVVGDFSRSMCEDPAKNFRHIHWPGKIDQLHRIHSQIGQHLIFGSHHSDQIEYLKSQFGSEVRTVAINYSSNSYTWLLNDLAKNHVRLMKNRIIVPSEHDQKLLDSLSTSQLIEHYQHAFDQLHLMPKSVSDCFDYTVDVVDFANKEKIANHVVSLGLEFSTTASCFYDQWLLHH